MLLGCFDELLVGLNTVLLESENHFSCISISDKDIGIYLRIVDYYSMQIK